MDGLISKLTQCFLRDNYGATLAAQVAQAAGVTGDRLEPLLPYDRAQTDLLLQAAARLLQRPRETVLEDLGTYLVAHANLEPLRRLLRFGGASFVDFLHSLEDLEGRARLALPDLRLPLLRLDDRGSGEFRLHCSAALAGFGHVLTGLLRGMADDYGALVVLDHASTADGAEVIGIRVLDQRFASGRRFDLAAGARG